MVSRSQLGGLLAAVVVAGAFAVLGRGAHYGQAGAQVVPGSSADARTAAAAPQPSKPSERTGEFATGASGSGDTGMDVGDILEPMAAQLADLLEHLREQCAAARRAGSVPVLSVAKSCVDAGEATGTTVELVRGTLASPAGRHVPGAVRSRWTRDLDAAAAEIRASLTPVQESLGRVLASGAPSPAAFRDLAHLRDRVALVLTELNGP